MPLFDRLPPRRYYLFYYNNFHREVFMIFLTGIRYSLKVLIISAFIAVSALAIHPRAFGEEKTANAGQINFKALVVSNDIRLANAEAPLSQAIAKLKEKGVPVEIRDGLGNAIDRLSGKKNLGAVIVDWGLPEDAATTLIRGIRADDRDIPIFLLIGDNRLSSIPPGIYKDVTALIRWNEDTPAFIAGTIQRELLEYRAKVLPPFFKALVKYVGDSKYAWSTPGHAGGLGFLSSVPGTAFFDFFGENIFRADLSSSMEEMGSILEHDGPAGDAEAEAAKVFGADFTFFVLNGTSTSNKIVWHGLVTSGDAVIADRNCHKSIMHSIIMTRSIPVYLVPTRNSYGIIGPIHMSSFEKQSVDAALKTIEGRRANKDAKPRIIVVTNSTYDGLCYDASGVKDRVSGLVQNIHFDEAWYGYAAAHPLYAGRFAMSSKGEKENQPPTFATQSTHKLLAAFSQSSMVHVKNGRNVKIDPGCFNEAFLMHASTSPFYPMFASIDISSKMMSGASGRRIVDNAIGEAVEFRKTMVSIPNNLNKGADWWFNVWQPDMIDGVPFAKIDDKRLASDPSCWILKDGDKWHGFPDVGADNVLLDPIKVTLLTPGINPDGTMTDTGIPAKIVTNYLHDNGVVAEKTGFYNFLFLFAPGVTRGKAGTLVSSLLKFKELYDAGASVEQLFPALTDKYPHLYKGKKISELANEIHSFLKSNNVPKMMIDIYSKLPEMNMLPADAYEEMVRGNIDKVPVSQLMGRTVSAMLVPYPPGIPVIMPGERFTPGIAGTIEYLAMCEKFDNMFPGFGTEIHGINVEMKDGRKVYTVDCVRENKK